MKKVKVKLRKDTPVLLEGDFVDNGNKLTIPGIVYLKPYICSITFSLHSGKLYIAEIERIDECSDIVINQILKAGTFSVDDYELLNFYFEICNEPTKLYRLKKELNTVHRLNKETQLIVNKIKKFDKTSFCSGKIINLHEYSKFAELKTRREKINGIFNSIYSEELILFDRINSRVSLNLPKKVISEYKCVNLKI